MAFKDFVGKLNETAELHKFDASFEGYSINGENLRKGLRSWPIAGAVADFQHGADVGSRVTLTRVALVGVFALGLKKNRNKVYVAIELADGEQILIEAKAKQEKKAREFASKINQAGKHHAV